MKYKTCPICGDKLPLTDKFFNYSTKGVPKGGERKWHGYCKKCKNMYNILYYHKNRLFRDPIVLKKFTTRQEVLNYLSGSMVECLLCGKKYRSLAAHLSKTHKMPAKQYKLLFNIPLTLTLNSALSKAEWSKEHLNSSQRLKHLKKISSLGAGNRKGQKTDRAEMTKKPKGLEIIRKNEKTIVELNCVECGKSYTRTLAGINKTNGKKYAVQRCNSCSYKNSTKPKRRSLGSQG
jgi:hypothetical protein